MIITLLNTYKNLFVIFIVIEHPDAAGHDEVHAVRLVTLLHDLLVVLEGHGDQGVHQVGPLVRLQPNQCEHATGYGCLFAQHLGTRKLRTFVCGVCT